MQRTGIANNIDLGYYTKPAFVDTDGDGTFKPRPSINELRPHVSCLPQATWT